MTACTTAEHEAMKRDEATWLSLRFIGRQLIEAFEDEPEEHLELRNCTACESTLARSVRP